MEDIRKFIRLSPKLQKLSGPLRAAQVCETARALADGRFDIISFKDGLLTLSVESPSAASNLQFETLNIMEAINKKLASEQVKRIRIKIA